MDRSPGFGSTACNFRPIQTRFPFGSDAPHLNLAPCSNSPVRSTKSNRSHIYVLPTSVSAWFQVLFHSPPGVLFTFPSRYYPLSVTKEYLALGGGPPCFPPDFSCPAVLRVPARLSNLSPTGLLPSLVPLSKGVRLDSPAFMPALYPSGISTWVWALSLSLATTQEIDSLSFPSATEMFQFTEFPPHRLCVQRWVTHCYMCGVPPFGHPRIADCLRLPVAFRSLPRPSSALGAKASPMRLLLLDPSDLLSFPGLTCSDCFLYAVFKVRIESVRTPSRPNRAICVSQSNVLPNRFLGSRVPLVFSP